MFLCSLHRDDVYYTLKNPTQNVAQPSKIFLFEDDLINNGKERWLVIYCEKSYKPF
ncbi:hypothetical protein Hanom_Chr07g00605021 [Helianthus anomalus]